MEPGTPITIKEIADLLLQARGRIDFYWNFYLAVVIAVIGWLVSRKPVLTTAMRVLVTAAYLIAAAMNFTGLYGSYSLAEALREDLLAFEGVRVLEHTSLFLDRYSYLPQRTVALIVHLVIAAVVLFVIWFGRMLGPRPPSLDDREG